MPTGRRHRPPGHAQPDRLPADRNNGRPPGATASAPSRHPAHLTPATTPYVAAVTAGEIGS